MILLSILFFLFLSAFFSGSEMAFVSASRLELELKKEKSTKRGNIITSFYNDSERFLSTMLIGNNLALVAFTYFTNKLINPFILSYLGTGIAELLVSTIIITVIVLIFGEFIPKLLFRLYAHQVMYIISYPLLFFSIILYLPSKLTNSLSKFFLSSVSEEPIEKEESNLNKTDLEHYIEDNIDPDDHIDKDIFTKALKLDQIKVKDCMVPRTEIIFVDIEAQVSELISVIESCKHSRIIIADQDIEKIIGYVHHQQLLELPKSLKSIYLPIQFIPEAMNAKTLMSKFINNDNNIACVVDEFGSISGLVTLEDLLEEIFGEIEDEHDREDYIDNQISNSEFVFSARLEIDFINDKYDEISLPSGDYHTLSGFLVAISGKIPSEGEVIDLNGYQVTIQKVSDTRIEQIRLEII